MLACCTLTIVPIGWPTMPHMLNDEFDDLPPLVDASNPHAFPGAHPPQPSPLDHGGHIPPTPNSAFAQFPTQFPEAPTYEPDTAGWNQGQSGSPWPGSNPLAGPQGWPGTGTPQGWDAAASQGWVGLGSPQQPQQLLSPSVSWPAYWQPRSPQQVPPPHGPFSPYAPPGQAPYSYGMSPLVLSPLPPAGAFLSPPLTPPSSRPSTSLSLMPAHTGRMSPGAPAWALERSASDDVSIARSRSHSRRKVKSGDLITGRPPASWRADFRITKTGGLGSLFRRKSISGGQDLGDITGIALHPSIQFYPRDPPLTWDVRLPPSASLQLHCLNRRLSTFDLAQYATNPPVPLMHLVHAHTPWIITVTPAQPACPAVTLHDLFVGLFEDMHRPISKADWWNDVLGDEARGRINKAFDERCMGDGEERSKGVRRVDFLGERYVLEGLVPGKRGVWELKTRSLDER